MRLETEMVTLQEFLETALSEFKRRGMHKGSAYGDNGSVCAMGAIDVAYRAYGGYSTADYSLTRQLCDRALIALQNVLLEETGSMYISDFNDAPETTQEDVELIFKKAIYEAGN